MKLSLESLIVSKGFKSTTTMKRKKVDGKFKMVPITTTIEDPIYSYFTNNFNKKVYKVTQVFNYTDFKKNLFNIELTELVKSDRKPIIIDSLKITRNFYRSDKNGNKLDEALNR